jgi:type IV pilus assembly protein PilF
VKRVLFMALLLAGCAQNAAKQGPTAAELPVSQQPAVGDARVRAKAHTDLGMLYYQGAKIGVALEEARTAVSADPGYAPAHNLMGLLHMYLKETQLADAAFQRSLSLAPNDPETNNNYGWFLCTIGREKDGIEHFLTAIKDPLYATPTKPYTNAGLCSLQLKDDRAAADYFRKAVTADRSNTEALYQLASLSYKRGDFHDAHRYIAAVHELMEPNAESLWLALLIERKLGNREAEAKYANQLRRNFAGSKEQQALTEGRFE